MSWRKSPPFPPARPVVGKEDREAAGKGCEAV